MELNKNGRDCIRGSEVPMTGDVAGKGTMTTVTWLENHMNHGANEA